MILPLFLFVNNIYLMNIRLHKILWYILIKSFITEKKLYTIAFKKYTHIIFQLMLVCMRD